MNIPSQAAQEILGALEQSKKVLIISHRNPDPDTLGSNAALKLFLEQKGKEVVAACVDPISPESFFLQPLQNMVNTFDHAEFDTFLCVDAGSTAQAAFPEKIPALLSGEKPFINIDHHPSNHGFGTINLVIDTAASTTLILFHLFKLWRTRITPHMATCLLHGLYYDTGSFMHSNTSPDALEAGAELLKLGADQKIIIQNLFKRKSLEKLKLWGKVLSSVNVTEKSVAVSAITGEEIADCGAKQEDLSGLIDYLNSIPDTQFATLISEDEKGFVRGSLRTHHESVNVSDIAGTFGGGGHKKASGFSVKGKLKKEHKWSIEEQ